jgi:hypothetical protein
VTLLTALSDPARMIRVHGWAALVWLVLAILTTAWALYDPENRYLLAWVVFMSAYANCASHWSAREGAAPSAKEEDV